MSLYDSMTRIVNRLIDGMRTGRSDVEGASQAMAELWSPPFLDSPESMAIAFDGMIRVLALQAASDYMHGMTEIRGPVDVVVVDFMEALTRHGFDVTRSFEAARSLEQQPLETMAERGAVVAGLFQILGLSLLFNPDAAASLQSISERIVALTQNPWDAAIAEFVATVERDGFSEYAFQTAMVTIRGLPNESVGDGLLKLIDVAVPLAPPEAAQTLAALRPTIEWMQTRSGEPLTPEEVRSECEATLSDLKTRLAAGEFPSAAITTAMGRFSIIAQQLPKDDEEAGKLVLRTIFKELFALIRPYAPEGTEHAFGEIVGAMDAVHDFIEPAISDDTVGMALAEANGAEQFGRLVQMPYVQQLSAEAAAVPHIAQFASLFPAFAERFNTAEAMTDNDAEMKRLRKRIDDPLQMLRAATTEEQIIRHQREALRRVALDFRRFEKRRHLMVAHPAISAKPMTFDPNDVFFSGIDSVAKLVRRTCEPLGMRVAPKPALQNETHARWQQLRGSGIAIFDYSSYDPARADPPGPVGRSPQSERKVLCAAGGIAQVAYENGWAYALGAPMIVVARKGSPVPFDIDVDPVLLEDDGNDEERLSMAIQTAFYGVQHGAAGDCLAATLEQMRSRYRHHSDPEVRTLLDAPCEIRDATRVRITLSAVCSRTRADNALLIVPTLAGSYPPEDERRLFHVTAFREWTAPVRREVENACVRAGIRYGIGSDRMTPDILQSVWTDICEASFILADITNLNPNALFELGVAHVLGRPALILTQNRNPHEHLPAIRHVRSHTYDPDEGRSELASLLDRFLTLTDLAPFV